MKATPDVCGCCVRLDAASRDEFMSLAFIANRIEQIGPAAVEEILLNHGGGKDAPAAAEMDRDAAKNTYRLVGPWPSIPVHRIKG